MTTEPRCRPIAPHLYQIVLPTPFPVGPVNVYLATGEPLTLVDTGPRTAETRAALETALAGLGYTLADIRRIIVTHAHADHYGLAATIVREGGAEVWTHPRNRPVLADYRAERQRRLAFYDAVLTQAGVPPRLRQAIRRSSHRMAPFAQAVPVARTLEEGDEVVLAGRPWRVLFTPGHAGGLICLYEPEQALLLSNDHLLLKISSNPLVEPPPPGGGERRRALVEYIASLERTASLEVEVAWPGHGNPITDHRALIRQRLAFHEQRAGRLRTVLDAEGRTVYQIVQALFPRLDPLNTLLAVSEVIGHLEWLEVRGEVRRWREGEVVRWGAVHAPPTAPA